MRLLQPLQVLLKLVPEEVVINGKLVRLLQPLQALLKLVPEEVVINGKLARLLQPLQALLKLVTFCVTEPSATKIAGTEAKLLHPFHVLEKVVAAVKSNDGKVPVMLLQSRNAFVQSVTALVLGLFVLRAELLKSIWLQP